MTTIPYLEVRWPKNPKVAPPITSPAAIEIRAIVASAFLVVVMMVMRMMIKMMMAMMMKMILSPFCTEPPKEANRGGVDAGPDRELKWNRFWEGSVLSQSLIRVEQFCNFPCFS